MSAFTYTLVYERDEDSGDIVATFPALDLATQGATLEEARQMAQEALELHLEGMIEDGDPLPADVIEIETLTVEIPEPKAATP